MNLLNTLYTRAKAWQIFVCLIVIPLIIQFALMFVMMAKLMENSHGSSPEELMANMSGFFSFIWIPLIIFHLLFAGWYWFCGHALRRLCPEQCRMSTTWFTVCTLFPLVYMTAYSLVMPHFMSFSFESPPVLLMLAVMPLHLFSLFCYFYLPYFVSRNLITATKQHAVNLEDYIIYIVALYFFPVGIWFVQPKINQLIEADYPASTSL